MWLLWLVKPPKLPLPFPAPGKIRFGCPGPVFPGLLAKMTLLFGGTSGLDPEEDEMNWIAGGAGVPPVSSPPCSRW